MKFCVNCKHVILEANVLKKYARCNYNNPISLVTGEPDVSELMFCQVQRQSEVDKHCGAAGKFYEEKTNV